jgi:alpha-galactosidase
MYVDKAKSKSVLFAYDIHPRFGEKTFPVKLQGLDPNKKYKVQEINLMPGQKSTLVTDGGTFSGDFLMKIGMNVFSTAHAHSKVIELTEAH